MAVLWAFFSCKVFHSGALWVKVPLHFGYGGFAESNLVVTPFGLHSGLRQQGKAFGPAVSPRLKPWGT
jgi:hypothetical protein